MRFQTHLAVLLASLAAAQLLPAAAPLDASARRDESGFAVDVFVSGRDGYDTYRIPAVIRAANGDLLAFCEGRRNSASDTGDIDLLMKRSSDGGHSWSAQQVIWDDGGNTCGNPCPVLDETTGTLWLFSTRNLGGDKEPAIHAHQAAGTRTVWVLSSQDQGATWTAPVDVTATTKDPSWGWYATGPGNGIQVRTGAHAGRLVIPCDHGYVAPASGKRDSGAHAVYSDDHGRTWKLGGVIRPAANECQVVELPDGEGTLLMNIRSGRGVNHRLESFSHDGGETWSDPKPSDSLIEPVCQGSIIRHPSTLSPDGVVLLFSNPADEKKRIRMTVRVSADRGRTWQALRELTAGPSAYSSLVSLGDAGAGCLFEQGENRPYERLRYTRFLVQPR